MKKILLITVMTIAFSIAANNKADAKSLWRTVIGWIIPDKKRAGYCPTCH